MLRSRVFLGVSLRSNFNSKSYHSLAVSQLSKVGSLQAGFSAFYSLPKIDQGSVYAYQSLIKLCMQFGEPSKAVNVWRELIKNRVQPDPIVFTSYISACRKAKMLEPALQALRNLPSIRLDRGVYIALAGLVRDTRSSHIVVEIIDHALSQNIALDPVVLGLLSISVMECKDTNAAEALIKRATDPRLQLSTVICNQIMQTFRDAGLMHRAVKLLDLFPKIRLTPSTATYRLLLAGCCDKKLFLLGKEVQSRMIRDKIMLDASLLALVLRLMAHTGRIDNMIALWTRKKVEHSIRHNLICWTVVIDGLGDHGKAQLAVLYFNEMASYGVKPDEKLFTALLNACSHVGDLEQVRNIYDSMESTYGILPNAYHRTALVDALARKGNLVEALDIAAMEQPPVGAMWTAVLSACRTYHNVPLAERAVAVIQQYWPDSEDLVAANVLLEQMYDHAGQITDRMRLRSLRQPSLVGITQIEVHGRVLSFKAHDLQLEKDPKLKAEVERLAQDILDAGHIPDLSHVDSLTLSSTPMSPKEKLWSLCTHSERIAIAYGLTYLAPDETLQLTKNLRVCRDCHEATKLISKIRNRKIIVGDAHRFHHIENGVCSCGDYW